MGNAAVAETEDLKVCKKACDSGQLKGKGIGCFVQKGGRTVFKQCTYDEAVAAKKSAKGSKLYIISDPTKEKSLRMMKAVEGEGLPRLRSPFEHGNLFIKFNIEFPEAIDPTAAAALGKLLPPPKNKVTKSEEDEEDEEGGPGGQRVQCAQQ